MTVLDVSPQVYYGAATACSTAASGLMTAFQAGMYSLRETSGMAGSVGDGKTWADSYDSQAKELWNLSLSTVTALDGYAQVLNQAGYNHALADYTSSSGSPEPQLPRITPAFTGSLEQILFALPTSAGGDGRGIVDDGLELAAKVGIPIPDGDTDKLERAAELWSGMSTHQSVTAVACELERAAAMFEQVTSPDANFIDEDLRELKNAASDLAGAYGEMAASCREQKQAHDNLRSELEKLLRDLADEIALEVAVSLALSVLASCVSFGVGGAAVAARTAVAVARIIDKFAGLIKNAIRLAKLKTAVTIGRITSKTKQTIQRIKDLTVRLAEKLKNAVTPKSKVADGKLFSHNRGRTSRELLDSGDHLPLNEDTIREYAKRAGVDLDGVEINIATSTDDIRYYDSMGASASTHENVINLAPSSFADEETLVRNLIHERVHVQQHLDGRTGQYQNLKALEDEAYAADEAGWQAYLRQKGN